MKQFRGEGCLSYLVYDREARVGILIDPNVELMDDYREFLADRRLKVIVAADTHTHADHFSASHMIRAEQGAEIAHSGVSESQRPTRKLKHGDRIAFGQFSLEALATPGHTPDSMSFYVRDGKVGVVFTGDTLFIGASGRTDFPGADPGPQWDSLHKVLGVLPDETVVFPGHDYNDRVFTTIGTEKRKNPHFLLPSREAFVAFKRSELVAGDPDEIKIRVAFNFDPAPKFNPASSSGPAAVCGVADPNAEPVAAIDVNKLAKKLEQPSDTLFIDVREDEEFAAGHIPGTRSIPVSEIPLYLAELSQASRIYVNCQGGGRSARVARSIAYVGHRDVVNVSGGFRGWQQAGLPVKK